LLDCIAIPIDRLAADVAAIEADAPMRIDGELMVTTRRELASFTPAQARCWSKAWTG
jgi:hypothetical protein